MGHAALPSTVVSSSTFYFSGWAKSPITCSNFFQSSLCFSVVLKSLSLKHTHTQNTLGECQSVNVHRLPDVMGLWASCCDSRKARILYAIQETEHDNTQTWVCGSCNGPNSYTLFCGRSAGISRTGGRRHSKWRLVAHQKEQMALTGGSRKMCLIELTDLSSLEAIVRARHSHL